MAQDRDIRDFSGAGASWSLADRASATDLVTAYADALDARDWPRFAALFDDPVEIDYSSLGTTVGVFPAEEWADRCRVLGGFAATHHRVSNFGFELSQTGLTVTSHVAAAHFIETGGQMLEAHVLGLYRHTLVRRGSTWRIARCELQVSGFPGGRASFDAAFAAARAAYASRRPTGAET